MGKGFITSGQSLFIDAQSIGFKGTFIAFNVWMFSLFVGLVDSLFGPWGSVVFRALLLIFPVGLLFYFCTKKLKIYEPVSFFICIFAGLCILTRVQMRPEIISYGFLVYFVMTLGQMIEQKELKGLFLLPLLQLIWVQNHSTSYFGVIVYFSFFIHWFFLHIKREVQDREALRKVSLGLMLISVANFLSPHLFAGAPLSGSKLFDNPWAPYIEEYSNSLHFVTPIQYVIIPLIFVLLLWGFYRRKIFIFLPIIVFGLAYIPYAKMMPHFGVLLGCLFALEYKSLRHFLASRIQPVYLQVLAILTVIAISVQLLAITNSTYRNFVFSYEDPYKSPIFPYEVTDYINTYIDGGNAFCSLVACSYLLADTNSKLDVYIDSRLNVLYPFEHFKKYREALVNQNALDILLVEEAIDWIVARSDWPERLADTASSSELVNVRFIGQSHILFSVNKVQTPTMTSLIYDPACVETASSEELDRELDQVSSGNGGSPRLRSMVELAKKYLASKEGQSSIAHGEIMSVWELRLAAYIMYKKQQYEASNNLIRSIGGSRRIKDYYLMAKNFQALGLSKKSFIAISRVDSNYLADSVYKHEQQIKMLKGLLNEVSSDLTAQVQTSIDRLNERLKLISHTPKLEKVRSCVDWSSL